MATTTNFGWTTPDDTDLVKDGAAAIRTLGSAIDTSLVDLKGGTTGQVLAKASNTDMDFTWATDASGIPATIFDAKGDLIAASAADTAARLAVGTNGQVLTADSAEATGLKWASPAAGANWSLVNAGGTNLTGAATITVSGITAKDKMMIIIDEASSASAASYISLQFNTDTGSNYAMWGSVIKAPSAYAASQFTTVQGGGTDIFLSRLSGSASSKKSGYLMMTGCKSAGLKIYSAAVGTTDAGSNSQESVYIGGYYSGTSDITSVSILSNTGNFDAGKIYIYTSE